MQKSKSLGQVYTPDWIVHTILDEAHYSGNRILGQTVLEPACGDGAFLIEIVRRYIHIAKQNGYSENQIIADLQTHIYGIEKDEIAHQQCINKLNQLTRKELASGSLKWQIFCADTLQTYRKYPQKFDFIFGNPPYIRIHNLDESTRRFIKENLRFSNGMTDIYVGFFEIALHMLKPNGTLGFITPNSFLHNTSYRDFRDFLQKQQHIKMLCDFKANKVFNGFSTYTAITIIDQTQQQNDFVYKEMSVENKTIIEANRIQFADLNPKKWTLSNRENSNFLKQLFAQNHTSLQEWFDIQYGFATLRDQIFIGKASKQNQEQIEFNGKWIERGILRKIIKGSRCKGHADETAYILFPYYEKNGRHHAYAETELAQKFPLAYRYLLDNKAELLKRDSDKKATWYEFGRNQGIQTSHKAKIVINPMVNDAIHFFRLPEDIFVYSGIFLSAKYHESDLLLAEKILGSPDFFRYARLTGKDLSGGYTSLSTKQIQAYRFTAP